MKKKLQHIALVAAAGTLCLMLSGCGERIHEQQTEAQTQAKTEKETVTEAVTEAVTEKETQAQKLVKSVDYTSKDGTIRITLPDNTWKVTQDADELRVFKSENAAIINIAHASTPTQMQNLTVSDTEDELKATLTEQYTEAGAYSIESFVNENFNGISTPRYVVKYNSSARMWAFAVTYGLVGTDQAYVITGTVTDDNKALLETVEKSVKSFKVLGDETFRSITDEISTSDDKAKTQKTSETQVSTSTTADAELKSLTDYGTTAELVARDIVNVRLQPGTDADIITTLNQNDKVSVIGETSNWFKVSVLGNVGYIRKDFLVYGTTAQSETTAQSTTSAASSAELATATNYGSATTLYAASGDINVRTAPGTDAGVSGTLAAGNAVSVVGETDNWFIVSVNGSTGYVSKQFLVNSQPSTSTDQNNSGTTGGQTNAGQTTTDQTTTSSPSAVSGTVSSASVDSITISGDDGKTYTVYYGDASLAANDGLYSGVYVSVALDPNQAAGDGTLYATNVTAY